jgi:hypothetical protein
VRSVMVRVRAADLSLEMISMRKWLDHNHCESTKFGCDQDGDAIVLSIGFTADAVADAFASRFDGESSPVNPLDDDGAR